LCIPFTAYVALLFGTFDSPLFHARASRSGLLQHPRARILLQFSRRDESSILLELLDAKVGGPSYYL